MKKYLTKLTANVLLLSLGYQLVFPLRALALTSGPTTPEVQSFEPVGTTQMVDMFTGDFTYNIPLMDVEGFPINISYHGGINVEQEASWVGLGWNINPGEINRTVRGLPDDFNGETIEKTLNIADEVNYKVGTGISASLEAFGFNTSQYGVGLTLGVGVYVGYSNYRGLNAGGNLGVTVSVPYVSAGVDVGVGSQSGADIDFNASLSASQKVSDDVGVGIGVSGGTGFNSRTGLKDFSFGISASASKAYAKSITTENEKGEKVTKTSVHSQNIAGASFGSSIPIGMQNYVPVITNASTQKTFQFQARFGGEVFYVFPNMQLSVMKSTLSYDKDGSRPGYGYMFAENATEEGIMDFSREKDGYYNNTLKNLPLTSMTYDIYAVSGQGTGGMFRPFRNDIGTVYDPKVAPPKSTTYDLKLEAGLGNLFEIGTDLTYYDNENRSGAWKRLPFRGGEAGSMYEKFYFKQAGELTYNLQNHTTSLFNNEPVYLSENENTLKGKSKNAVGSMPSKFGNSHIYTGTNTDRTTRANLLSYITGEDADITDVAQTKKVIGYTGDVATFYNPTVNQYDRHGTASDKVKKHHPNEFTQTLPDGRRYVYGIPAVNHVTKEVSFAVNGGGADMNTGLVTINRPSGKHDDSKDNDVGKEKFYSYTGTPAYTYSYLLTSILSNDYVDVLGDGPTDDDLGAFTKINYTKWDEDYRWRAPYPNDKAQYNPGFWSDPHDDKGSYIMGSKDIWHVRSIETKNYVAEFYVSRRADAKGSSEAILPSGSTIDVLSKYSSTKNSGINGGQSYSYKLDSIRLYNKQDRYTNENNATPIKTVVFRYSYRLCKGVPNYDNAIDNNTTVYPEQTGKLTLERIYIKYGNSEKNLLSPYVFTYSSSNPSYNFACKDRWGTYKPNNSSLPNFEYPYVDQSATDNDANASAWSLTDIKLPSGGKIHVEYESDDYSYVQDRRSMEMFKVEGVGNSESLETKNRLYEDVERVNNYVYFKRRKSKENNSLSLKDNYLEGATYLYYSFSLDISGKGKYENIKGYAKIESVGACPNNDDYGYVKLVKERPGENSPHRLHPATIYGLNVGRAYIPQVIYPGFDGDGKSAIQVMNGLKGAAGELLSIKQDPIVRFVERDKKGRNIKIEKSWVRLYVPGLTKKGGGLRVKELTLNDSWNELTNSPNSATYGKKYDYTIWDSKWNRNVSSGVASYEPTVGGDENPFRLPVHYTTDGQRGLPAKEFFQEEPFGESFFPSPLVGYSKVTVKSIHADDNSRSSQSVEEQIFYTAKDFPIVVDYTEKDELPTIKTKKLRKKYEEVTVLQGYVLRFNDMHGKLRKKSTYVLRTDGATSKMVPVSSMTYNYHTDAKGQLNNVVNALVRERGTDKNYTIRPVKLGEEMDFSVDSRERYIRNYSRNIDINVNLVLFGIFPVPIPTAFFPDKEDQVLFHSLVSTKIIQQYGIVKSVESYEDGAKVVLENVLYDSETGGVILTKSNTPYANNTYDLKYPAYLAYRGMQPSYRNMGYEENGVRLEIIDHLDYASYYGRLFVDNKKFHPGDELLLTYKTSSTSPTYEQKVWVMEGEGAYGYHEFDTPYIYREPFPRTKNINFALQPYDEIPSSSFVEVVPRAIKDASGNIKWAGGLTEGSSITDVHVKVLRSGYRNNLDQFVQQTTLTENPNTGTVSALFGGSSAFDKVLNVSTTVYSDVAAPFGSRYGDSISQTYSVPSSTDPYYPSIFPVNNIDGNMKEMNRYVIGYKGNYRPVANYVYKANRDYSNNSIKYDGTFSIKDNPMWNYSTSTYYPWENIFILSTTIYNWVEKSRITKNDVFGNSIEEKDAAGKYTSAQYGYNKTLPVAVASNVRQKGFCFDGFEDYNILIPKYLKSQYIGTWYYHSPFAKLFSSSTGPITRYNQEYVRNVLTASSGQSITSAASHTGSYSFISSSTNTYTLPVKNPTKEVAEAGYMHEMNDFRNVKEFSLDSNRKYVLSLWFKPTTSSSPSSIAQSFGLNIGYLSGLVVTNFSLKTQNINGWYKAECVIDLRQQASHVDIIMPANVYIDDIRFVPIDATMKSFVYHPVSYKLAAQLDENNFATFYEYDQEGLLVRTKKETEKGILTISENRRANSKKP